MAAGINHTMIDNLHTTLYGDNLTSPFINLDTSAYQTSNVSILMHALGKAPTMGGAYMVRNRLIGQIKSPTGLGYVVNYLNKSDQVHVISVTSSYTLGGVEFSPNDVFSPNTMDRWTGLIFGNRVNSAIGLPHGTGDKWSVTQQWPEGSVMIAQNCGTCGYKGAPLISIQGATSIWQNSSGDGSPWVFIEAAAAGQDGTDAWAAVRPAWGGFTGDLKLTGNLILTEPWAPLVFIVGEEAVYGDSANFTQSVLGVQLILNTTLSSSMLDFRWGGHEIQFYPNNATKPGSYQLPRVDGTPIDISPSFVYSSPHLTADLGSNLVIASYKGYILEYDFARDEIRRQGAVDSSQHL